MSPAMPEPPLRLLAPAREVGDLFTRLVAGFFESLGYQTWENVGTAGREVDILGRHREEPHRRRSDWQCDTKGGLT
jgi:hypothetical protein